MYSFFIPEDRAGSIICQLVAEIPRLDLKRKRIAQMRDAIKMMRLLHMAPAEPDVVTSVSYGCNADGTVGLVVLCGIANETVATSKGDR